MFTSLVFVYHRLPFNWRTPLGYAIAELTEFISYVSLLSCVLQTLFFYAASLWLIIKFTEDIANDLESLNVGGRSEQSRLRKRKQLCKIIEMHSNLKQLSANRTYSLLKTIWNQFIFPHFFFQDDRQFQWHLRIHNVRFFLVYGLGHMLLRLARPITIS